MNDKIKKLYDKDDKIAYKNLLELKLKQLNLSKYKENMQSLIKRDIDSILKNI